MYWLKASWKCDRLERHHFDLLFTKGFPQWVFHPEFFPQKDVGAGPVHAFAVVEIRPPLPQIAGT